MVNEQSLPQIVGVLLASIRDSPLIAEKVCYALAQLAAGFKDSDQTSLLSPYFKDIVGALLDAVRLPLPCGPFSSRTIFALLACSFEQQSFCSPSASAAERCLPSASAAQRCMPGAAAHKRHFNALSCDILYLPFCASQQKMFCGCMQAQRQGEPQEVARLQAQAFEAINDAVRSASADTLPLVAQLIPLMLSKLGSTFQAPANSADERERQSELQVHLQWKFFLWRPFTYGRLFFRSPVAGVTLVNRCPECCSVEHGHCLLRLFSVHGRQETREEYHSHTAQWHGKCKW